jgi:hypothetical protein
MCEVLIDSLATGEAVVFVGSGASAPADLPVWRPFLQNLLERAIAHSRSTRHSQSQHAIGEWDLTKGLIDDGQYLLAAEMLQRHFDQITFARYIEDVFGRVTAPSGIHLAIARLPFSLALTTNFDKLLETAYREPPNVITWANPGAVFEAIRLHRFAIVKIHGTVGDAQSLRLTRTHYRMNTHENPAFTDCLRSLLLWKTLLFVGYSLRDSDLLSIIDEGRVKFGRDFGPHFAIMPSSEVDAKFAAYLKDALGVHVIQYQATPADDRAVRCQRVVTILRDLAGKVANRRLERTRLIDFNDRLFHRDVACARALAQTVTLTGSFRGDICFAQNETIQSVKRVATFPPDAEDLPQNVAYDSVIGTVLLQANYAQDYIYLPDTSPTNVQTSLRTLGYPSTQYVLCHTEVKSELASPIISDGQRVGVLNLESDLLDGYTEDHIEVSKRIAEQVGLIYYEVEQRKRIAARLGEFYLRPDRFRTLMYVSRLIRDLKLEFLLYEIDYERGILQARSTAIGENETFGYAFSEHSLATWVFRFRQSALIPDVQAELKKPNCVLSRKGIERFAIDGPLFACAVRNSGQMAAILVTWPQRSSIRPPASLPSKDVFDAASERVYRIANLLSNDITENGSRSAETLLNYLDKHLFRIDGGRMWNLKNLRSASFRRETVCTLMEALILETCGLKRIRIWRRIPSTLLKEWELSPSPAFYCVDSLTTSDATISGKPTRGAYKDCAGLSDDPYCRYTVGRYAHDPFGKWQHPSMFGGPDVNATVLDKDPAGSWAVAPIVHNHDLLGFVSADTHISTAQGPKELAVGRNQAMFQARAMDVIADTVRFVLLFWDAPALEDLFGSDGARLIGKPGRPRGREEKRESRSQSV